MNGQVDALKLLHDQMREMHIDVSRSLQVCWQQADICRRECADSRDRIEHLIERVQSLEGKINALADKEEQRRDEIIDRIQALIELTNTRGGAR